MADKAATGNTTESKRDKFVRLAQARTSKALDAIANLRGLASKNNYEYTDDDWTKIFGAMEGELTKLQNAVKTPDAVAETGFTL